MPRPLSWGLALVLAFLAGYLGYRWVILPTTSPDPGQTTIPEVIGMTVVDARTALEEAALKPVVVGVHPHAIRSPGAVIDQAPFAGLRVQKGTEVKLLLSAGPLRLWVPDVIGLPLELAEEVARRLNLKLMARRRVPSVTVPQGRIVSVTPPPGTPIEPGGFLTVVVSEGLPTVEVPDLTGLSLEAATTRLDSLRLRVAASETLLTQGPEPGHVVVQEPFPGFLVPQGTEVRVKIARRP